MKFFNNMILVLVLLFSLSCNAAGNGDASDRDTTEKKDTQFARRDRDRLDDTRDLLFLMKDKIAKRPGVIVAIPIAYILMRESQRRLEEDFERRDRDKLKSHMEESALLSFDYQKRKFLAQVQRAIEYQRQREKSDLFALARVNRERMDNLKADLSTSLLTSYPIPQPKSSDRKVITYISNALLGKNVTIKFIADAYVPFGETKFIKGNIVKVTRLDDGAKHIVEYIWYPIMITNTIEYEGGTLYKLSETQ